LEKGSKLIKSLRISGAEGDARAFECNSNARQQSGHGASVAGSLSQASPGCHPTHKHCV